MGFFKVSTAFFKENTNIYEQTIYTYLKGNIGKDGYAAVSYNRFASTLGISKSKVIKTIQSLIDKGIIKKERIREASGGYNVNHYYLYDTAAFFKANISTRKEMLEELYMTYVNDTSEPSDLSLPFSFLQVFKEFMEIDRKKLSAKEKAVYLALKRHKNNKTGFCFPSLNTLAKELSCCKKTVAKYINELIKKGIITKTSYYNSTTGRRSSNRYTLSDEQSFLEAQENSKQEAQGKPKPKAEENTKKYSSKQKDKKKYKDKQDAFSEEWPDYWTDEAVRTYYHYDDLLIYAKESHINEKYIDKALAIIRRAFNSKKSTFWCKDEELPISLLRAEYQKLTEMDIIEAIKKYQRQTIKINHQDGYLRTLLYTIRQESMMETDNAVMHDLYGEH